MDRPAKRYTNTPDPVSGWSASELSDDERVDDGFIADNAARVYEPLMPEDEKLFPVYDEGNGLFRFSGLTTVVNDTGDPEEML